MSRLIVDVKKRRNGLLFVTGLGFLAYAALIFAAPSHLLYDENHYVHTVTQLAEKGASLSFLRELQVPAGPLYALVHWTFAPISRLSPLGIRLVNLLMLAGVVCGLALVLSSLRLPDAGAQAARIIVAPTVGVVSCLALTELPAMLCCTVAIAVLARCQGDSGSAGVVFHFMKLLTAGGFLALAVAGRQNYLAVWAAATLLFFPWSWKRILDFAVFSVPIIAVAAGFFFVWGGFVPEAVRFVEQGVSVRNGVLSMGIACILLLVLCPTFLKSRPREYLACLLTGFLGSAMCPQLRFVPSKSWSSLAFGESSLPVIGLMGGAIFGALAAILLVACVSRIFERPYDSWFLFANTAWLGILLSNIKITHQFSTRYVTVALPFLLLAGSLSESSLRREELRLLIGLLASIVLVLGYYP